MFLTYDFICVKLHLVLERLQSKTQEASWAPPGMYLTSRCTMILIPHVPMLMLLKDEQQIITHVIWVTPVTH